MIKTYCIWVIVLSVCLSGCRRQTVRPVEPIKDSTVCIVENAAVKPEVLDIYKNVLSRKGYVVRVLPSKSSVEQVRECSTYSTFTANWNWGLCWYLARAEIRVFKDGIPSGSASYVAKKASRNKCISAEEKFTELVDKLFPNAAAP